VQQVPNVADYVTDEYLKMVQADAKLRDFANSTRWSHRYASRSEERRVWGVPTCALPISVQQVPNVADYVTDEYLKMVQADAKLRDFANSTRWSHRYASMRPL